MVPTVEPTDDCWIVVLHDRKRTRLSPRGKNGWPRGVEGAWGQKEHTPLGENPKDLEKGMTMRTFGLPEGEAQHRRARHRQLPHLGRLHAEEIRAVVNFDENLARWAQCSRLPLAKVGRHVDEAGRTVVAILLRRREVAMEGSTFGAEGNTGVTD